MNILTKLATTGLIALSPMAATAEDAYTIDPAHAWVNFSINHAGWANAQGQFREVSGEILFDRDNVANSSLHVEIATASVDTNHDKRNEHLTSPDFLNALEFPTITFVSETVTQTGERTGTIEGILTLVGTSHPITLDVVWNDEKPLPWDASVVKTGFSATGTFQPADYGMAKVAEFGLGPDVDLRIEVEAIKN